MLKSYKKQNGIFQTGFTLLEILVVLVIIAMLAFMAVPSQMGKVTKVKIVETLDLVEHYQSRIEAFYKLAGDFPKDNVAAAMPQPDKIVGNYLKGLEIDEGAMHLILGQKLTSLEDKIITVYPVYVKDSPDSPISWVCGHGKPPEGMEFSGENKTSVPRGFLPLKCI